MKKVFPLVLIFSLLGSLCVAQQLNLDSAYATLRTLKSDTIKVGKLNKLSFKLTNLGNNLAADSLAKVALHLADSLNYDWGRIGAHNNMGLAFEGEGNYPEALKQHFLALNISDKRNDLISKATSYNNIGLVYDDQQNYSDALKNHFEALKIREQLKDSAELGVSYNNISIVYMEEGDYVDALKYNLKEVENFKTMHNHQGLSNAYMNIGLIYYGEADSAGAKGNNNAADKKYAQALENYETALKMLMDVGDKYSTASCYGNIGQVLVKLKKYAQATGNFKSGVELAEKYRYKDVMGEILTNMAELDSINGNYKQAYLDYRKSIVYRDSLVNEENTKKTVKAQMQYEFDKKEASQKAEQEKKDAVSAAEKNKQQVIIYSVSAGLLLMLVLAGLILRGYSQKRKANALLEEKNKTIQEQKAVVEHQKAIVEEKNKDITDSIHYASRIQRALLTSEEYIGKYVKEYFILFKPRDIVSGDFYWAFNADDKFYIACCDCTGHGVPGAFMSLLNISMLNESIIERKILSPDKVLNDIRSNIIKSLNPEGKDEGSKDGMDCILCSIDFKANVLQAACANNPICIVKKDGSVKEINADKMPVGIQHGEQKPFTLHTEKLEAGDTLYLFTDGYADQFGGPKGKKFKYKQLQEKLQSIVSLPMNKQKEELNTTIESWKGNLEQVDDILIIGIRV